MKRLLATVSPNHLDDLSEALDSLGVRGIAVSWTHVRVATPRRYRYRGVEYAVPFTARYQLELCVRDDQLAPCLQLLNRHSGESGSVSQVLLFNVDDAMSALPDRLAQRAA